MLLWVMTCSHKDGEYGKRIRRMDNIFNEVQNDSSMQKLWNAYQKKFSYAEDISWDMVMESIKELHCMSMG